MSKLTALIILLCLTTLATAQKFSISGIITDEETGESMISANVYEKNSLSGTVSNNYGFFSINLPQGKVTIICSYIGYQSQEISFVLKSDTTIQFQLDPSIAIKEVVVTDKGTEQRIKSTQMSMVELPVIQTKQLPVLLGEVDVLKSLQLMPGVQSGTEGSTGLYVRGGGPDQNLILLDGVPVYNVNHLFGFFSVFNADAIKSVSLTKGGFPARYGGRLSSVVDIRMKEGNMKKLKGNFSLGLLSSQATLEGPLKKDKTSFIISGRRSYYDLLTYPFQLYANSRTLDQGQRAFVGAYFYDLNAKINHIINEKNHLYLSAYLGKDKFYTKFKSLYDSPDQTSHSEEQLKAGLNWGNATVALRWNHIFGNNLFSNLNATFSDYTFDTKNDDKLKNVTNGNVSDNSFSFDYYSRIRDVGLKYDFEYSPAPNHYLHFGLDNTTHLFSPGVTVFQDKGSEFTGVPIDTTFGHKNIPANEFYAYAEDEISFGKRLKVNAGIHYSNFAVADSFYHSFEPRISARYLLKDNFSLKASYVRMTQYINLLSNSNIGLPTDLWVPCTQMIHPQKAWQAALGFATSFADKYELTVEGFYKQMSNLVEYKEGASFFQLNTDWESMITQGKGKSYGIEFFLQKTQGKTTGWIGYTLSWSTRRFADISFGRTFPYKYDRRHDISLVMMHKFSDRFNISAAWVFGTGNAITLPDESYASQESIINNSPFGKGYVQPNYDFSNYYSYTSYFEKRNSYRMPVYHRLDIGFNFTKQKPRVTRTWNLGVYNIYAHRNPFYLYQDYEYNNVTGETFPVIKQLSILTFVPYFRYNLSF